MREVVKIRRHGTFYGVYEDDAYVVHAITKYKISNGKLGFPDTSLGKVMNELSDHKISYCIIDDDIETEKEIFPKSKYEYYLEEGMKSHSLRKEETDMIETIKKLGSSKLEKLINYVKELALEEENEG